MDWLVGLYTYYAAMSGFYLIPVASVDVNNWHIEARYNYEDVRTASVWAGPTFEWKGAVPGYVAPLGGVVFGNLNGVALGLETETTYDIFSLYAEAEYVVVPSDRTSDYFYLWADFTATFWEQLHVGLTLQRLRAVEQAPATSPGAFVGTTIGIVTPKIYAFGLTSDEPYFMLSIDVEW